MSKPYSIGHRDDFERNQRGWVLVRRSLGIGAFGINEKTIAPGESIVEHDETEHDQEELFLVESGHATFVVDGTELDGPDGTFLRVDPAARRNVLNRSDQPLTILIISAPRGSGYVPPSWA